MEIHSKTAIVTGASGGLGKSISKALLDEGAKVYGVARNRDSLNQLHQELGNNFIPVPLDISQMATVEKWVLNTFSKNSAPDILINNAGVGSFGKIDEMPIEAWTNMLNTNLTGVYAITSSVVKFMKVKKGPSHIINIGSILGITTRSEGAAYSATKYGINGFNEALSKELRNYNIKVSCLNPGSIETDFFKSSGIESHRNMLQPRDIAATLVHVLKTPDNLLISDMTIRPLNPKEPD